VSRSRPSRTRSGAPRIGGDGSNPNARFHPFRAAARARRSRSPAETTGDSLWQNLAWASCRAPGLTATSRSQPSARALLFVAIDGFTQRSILELARDTLLEAATSCIEKPRSRCVTAELLLTITISIDSVRANQGSRDRVQ